MNKDLELSILRKASKKYGDALRTIRQDAHDSWGTSGPHNALKRIEKAAAHALDYTTMPDSSQQAQEEIIRRLIVLQGKLTAAPAPTVAEKP